MCVSDRRSQNQGDHEGRPYGEYGFVGATLVVALARTLNGTDGART